MFFNNLPAERDVLARGYVVKGAVGWSVFLTQIDLRYEVQFGPLRKKIGLSKGPR